jgi:hypothetical protein
MTTVEPPDYSLVLGGPLFHLYRKAHLSGDALELLWRRVLVISLVAWLPLLLLSELEGHVLHASVKIPFLYDVEAFVRFLVALPVLIAAELIVHRRVTGAVRKFVERRIVTGDDLPKFDLAIRSTARLRNSVALELLLVALVYTGGFWIWRSQIALGSATWYASPDKAHLISPSPVTGIASSASPFSSSYCSAGHCAWDSGSAFCGGFRN